MFYQWFTFLFISRQTNKAICDSKVFLNTKVTSKVTSKEDAEKK
jgi:hypothetical protein